MAKSLIFRPSPFYHMLMNYTLLSHNRLYDTYGSYFGGLNCVAWSPDGRYILVCELSVSFNLTAFVVIKSRANALVHVWFE